MKPTILALAVLAVAGAASSLSARAAQDQIPTVRSAVMFWLFDRNGDGAIDQGEANALRMVFFDAADRDGDQRLTAAEAKASFDGARASMANRLSALIKEGPGAMAARYQNFAERLGLNKPGGLARADFVNAESRLFASADANGDDRISKSEFEAASGNMRQLVVPE